MNLQYESGREEEKEGRERRKEEVMDGGRRKTEREMTPFVRKNGMERQE